MPGEIKDYKLQRRRQEILSSLDLHLNATNAFDSLVSSTPTPYLILLNAGYTGGTGSVDSDAVESRFKEFNVEHVVMPLSKPYCFLVFSSSRDAAEARDSLDQTDQWDRTILLECIHGLPPNLCDRVLSAQEEINECIPGLHYISDFVSLAEEEALLKGIYGSSNDWISLHYRRVKHFGYQFDYSAQAAAASESFVEMPEWTRSTLEKYSQIFPSHPVPNQLTVNGYEPGDGIGPHLDSPQVFEPGPILILSLQSDIVMEFKKVGTPGAVHVDLRARSLLVMTGESRLSWKHAIRPRKADSLNGRIRARHQRASLTFRRVTQGL